VVEVDEVLVVVDDELVVEIWPLSVALGPQAAVTRDSTSTSTVKGWRMVATPFMPSA
jgi:hypothetical protein